MENKYELGPWIIIIGLCLFNIFFTGYYESLFPPSYILFVRIMNGWFALWLLYKIISIKK